MMSGINCFSLGRSWMTRDSLEQAEHFRGAAGNENTNILTLSALLYALHVDVIRARESDAAGTCISLTEV